MTEKTLAGYVKSSIGGLRLTRKVGETLVINNGEIVIEVVQIFRKEVRLAIKAKKEISIWRGELSSTHE